MARLTEPSKHTVYYELLDACQKGGCPICTMALDTVARYLDSVIKHDYRFTKESMGAEGNSWIRAIEMVAGKQGIR